MLLQRTLGSRLLGLEPGPREIVFAPAALETVRVGGAAQGWSWTHLNSEKITLVMSESVFAADMIKRSVVLDQSGMGCVVFRLKRFRAGMTNVCHVLEGCNSKVLSN